MSGARVLVKDKLLRVPDTCTALELLRNVATDREEIDTRDDTPVTVQCSKNGCDGWIDTELTSNTELLVGEFRCRYIRFTAPVERCPEEPASKHARTVSDVLMGEAQARDKLPKSKHVINRKAELFNAVRGLLVSRKIGFHSSTADSEGFDTVNTLTNNNKQQRRKESSRCRSSQRYGFSSRGTTTTEQRKLLNLVSVKIS